MSIVFDYSNVISPNIDSIDGFDHQELEELAAVNQDIHYRLHERYDSDELGFYNLPFDKETAESVKTYAESARERFKYFVHVGIGGSALGPIVLQNSLNSQHHNLNNTPKIFFPDNVDPDWISELLEVIEPGKTLFNIVSKSGGTAETAATLLHFMDHLKKAVGSNFYKNLVFTTDPHKGLLNEIAQENAIKCFRIPPNVGGRFSVLTPVGLLPAAMSGININKVLKGAAKMAERCKSDNLIDNPAFLFAAIHTLYMKRGKNISVMMPYSNKLKDLADWYCQLWAESLGKRVDRKENTVNVGQTPVKALGATDQHSQVQLYMEGPNDKVITFIEVEKFKNHTPLKNHFPYIEDFNYLAEKSLGELLSAEKKATELALSQSNRPNVTLRISEVNEESIGGLFFFFEAATAYAGELLDINAFNQPGVEAGKIATYALMGRSGYDTRRKEIEAHAAEKKIYQIS